MNLNEERKAFEEAFRKTKTYETLLSYIDIHNPIYRSVFAKDGKKYANEVINTSWDMWQAAKAHEAEKLKDCVLVPVEPTDLMINAYRDNSVAPISTLSVVGYKAMLEAARGGK